MAKKPITFDNLNELDLPIVTEPSQISHEKILILSLGTGQMNEDGSAVYKEAQYAINGVAYARNGIESKTCFVAEPLISDFEPDIVVIMGTVKSAWYTFYASMTTIDDSDKSYMENIDYQRLVEINKDYGIKTDLATLDNLGKEITKIFGRISDWKRMGVKNGRPKPRIRILLTRYGINQEELNDNYVILKRIEGFMKKGVEYEVAFDMTHSFRSLPIYNLVILNYIKNITKFKIEISHVYYGNLESSGELGFAPIVDLAELVNVMNLMGGVAEFRDTGNAVTLLNLITEDELKSDLEAFDLATQLNAFSRIKELLARMIRLVQVKSDEEQYTGIREMINIVLGERFFDGQGMTAHQIELMSEMDIKFLLTRWYFRQNRMGLGLATGIEALRDLNTPAFLAAMGKGITEEKADRVNAESDFVRIAKKLQEREEKTELEKVFSRLGSKLESYKRIRHMFAHSLSFNEAEDIAALKQEIIKFKEDLFELKALYDENEAEYFKLFARQPKNQEKRITENACRIVLNCGGSCDYERYKSNLKRNFDVYYLDNGVKQMVLDSGEKQGYLSEKAFFLYQYLHGALPDGYQSIIIIVHGCADREKEFKIRMFIEQIANEDKRVSILGTINGSLRPFSRLGMTLAMDEIQEKHEALKDRYESIMREALVQA